jgi:hypothetical protein
VPVLKNIATRLRIESIRATTESASGHPTTCMSAADLMAALFFAEMRYDPANPRHEQADRLVLSKGHAAPLLYAAWAEAGFIEKSDLLNLRKFTSDLEGHPTPRLPFVDVATGSLGQGLCAGIGTALNARRLNSDYRTYVLMGDGRGARFGVGGGGGRQFFASTTSSASPTSTPSARAAAPSSNTISARSSAAGTPTAGTPSPSTATTWRRSSAPSPKPAAPPASPR